MQLDDEITKEYFSRIAREKSRNENANSDKYQVIRQLMLPCIQHEEILECGGGAGFYTKKILIDGYTVTCVDIAHDALQVNMQEARILGKDTHLKVVTADFIDFCQQNPHQFDQILFIKVLHHFDSLARIKMAILHGIKQCQKGGRIIIFEPNGMNICWKIFLSFYTDNVTGRSKWFYEQNMRYTTMPYFVNILTELKTEYGLSFSYKIGHHYIIPSLLLNKYQFILLRKMNTILEACSFKKRFAFNLSVTIDV
ncbi:MAG: class I SAM-dependent methyltransferase [bacterium]|nr:class I SAM-dependent methyltransferase [bacterium]